MDNLDNSNAGNKNADELIPLDDNTGNPNVSHSPLDLGGGGAVEVPKLKVEAQPAKPVEETKVVEKTKVVAETVAAERITGARTFFTKLHAGAIAFLDEQITKWLSQNPGISVKRTNVVTGEIQGKKTEPNIIITVWY